MFNEMEADQQIKAVGAFFILLGQIPELNIHIDYKSNKMFSLIVITGALDPPEFVKHEKRNRDGNNYLNGVKQDVLNIKQIFSKSKMELFVLENPGSSCSLVLEHISAAIQARPDNKVLLYYTGHGAYDGSWCFSDGTLSPIELRNSLNSKGITKVFTMIISDSCFSGNFCRESVINKLSYVGNASSLSNQVSYDSDKGGAYTRFLLAEMNEHEFTNEFIKKQQPVTYRLNPHDQNILLSQTLLETLQKAEKENQKQNQICFIY